jgi:hypothetical protein
MKKLFLIFLLLTSTITFSQGLSERFKSQEENKNEKKEKELKDNFSLYFTSEYGLRCKYLNSNSSYLIGLKGKKVIFLGIHSDDDFNYLRKIEGVNFIFDNKKNIFNGEKKTLFELGIEKKEVIEKYEIDTINMKFYKQINNNIIKMDCLKLQPYEISPRS